MVFCNVWGPHSLVPRWENQTKEQITKGSIWAGYLISALRSKGVGGRHPLLIYQTFPTHFRTSPALPPAVSFPPWSVRSLGGREPDVLGSHELACSFLKWKDMGTSCLLIVSLESTHVCVYIYIYIHIYIYIYTYIYIYIQHVFQSFGVPTQSGSWQRSVYYIASCVNDAHNFYPKQSNTCTMPR